jgi:hypothetical protein
MHTITLRAHFDGKHIRLDEPYELKPNTKLIITVLPKQEPDEENDSWLLLSGKQLARAYGEDEVEYSLNQIKESNPDYHPSAII